MRRTEAIAQRRGSRTVLPRLETPRCQRARGDRGHRTCSLVRAITGGTGFRAMDWRPGPDQGCASAEAEDRSSGCGAAAEAAGGRALPTHLGTESGESGCAPTTVASASAGADADPSHESVAGRGDE